MGLFDRFTSRKGKSQSAKPKAGPTTVDRDEAKKKIFSAVPSGKEAPAKSPAKAEEKKSVTPTVAKTAAKESTGPAHRILLRAVISEKSTRQGKDNPEIRSSVQMVYGIKPLAVNIVRLRGKSVRYGRATGRTIQRKKAIVTLPPGKTIDIMSA
jgi:ribosomal protein L23